MNRTHSLISVSLGCLLSSCASKEVDLGGGAQPESVVRGARCIDSTVVTDPVRVQTQAELEALAGCEEVQGDLSIGFFAGADLTALGALRAVGGQLSIGAAAEPATESDDLSDQELADFRAARDQDRVVAAQGFLPSLHGLESLERVGSLSISGIAAPDLKPLSHLQNLNYGAANSVSGLLVLSGNQNLKDLQGLESAEGLDNLLLDNNPALESLTGLNVPSIELTALSIGTSRALTNIDALAALIGVSAGVFLNDTGIENLDALSSLQTVGALDISENRELVDASGLTELNSAQSIHYGGNSLLETLPTFSKLNDSGLTNFVIRSNPQLSSLTLGFGTGSGWVNVAQNVVIPIGPVVIEIGNNDKLETITGPSGALSAQAISVYQNRNLSQIDFGSYQHLQALSIDSNPALASIGVGALDAVDSLLVTNNPQLSTTAFAAVRSFDRSMTGNADEPAP